MPSPVGIDSHNAPDVIVAEEFPEFLAAIKVTDTLSDTSVPTTF